MPDDPHLPWTDEQWATVQRTVQESARKARVAGSFLPLVGPLPDGQASVPALPMSQRTLERYRGEAPERLEVDDGQTCGSRRSPARFISRPSRPRIPTCRPHARCWDAPPI
jgi:hypothetical protein